MANIGIDEAGRGPVAGPLSICALKVLKELDFSSEPLLYVLDKKTGAFKDSKKLTEARRENLFDFIVKSKDISFEHVFISAKYINRFGIKKALQTGVLKLVDSFVQKEDFLLMDGALEIPDGFCGEVIKKGDEKVLEIALASVVAKVKRDKYMCKIDKKYPSYGFCKHKGYGTAEHIKYIKEKGLCPEHRKNFLSRILES